MPIQILLYHLFFLLSIADGVFIRRYRQNRGSEITDPLQTVEKAVRPQGIKDKKTNIKNSHAGNKRKTFIENALRFLAFSVFALWRTPVRRRMQKRKIYLPFSTSASVSRLSRHASGIRNNGSPKNIIFYSAEATVSPVAVSLTSKVLSLLCVT